MAFQLPSGFQPTDEYAKRHLGMSLADYYGRNPGAQQAYENTPEKLAQKAEEAARRQREEQAALAVKQKAEQQEFLGRYTTGLEGARTAAETELGLPQLRESTQVAGQSARTVSRQVQDIPEVQKTISKQVGISAPRLALRTSAETAKLLPSAESARRALEDAVSNQTFGETEYTERVKEYSQPFQLEASMLSEGLAREFSGFTQAQENELEVALIKLQNGQALSLAEIQRAEAAAQAEAEFQRQKQLLSFQSQLGLQNEEQMKARGLGSYYEKPKLAALGSNNPAGI